MKTKNDITVRKIKNNGTDAWIYRGTEKQIKKSCSKYQTEDDFKDYVLTILNSNINASEHVDDLKIINSEEPDSVTKIEPEAKSQEQIERSEFQIVFPSIDDYTEEFEELDIDDMLEELEPKEPFEWFIIEELEHLSISKRAEAVFGIKSNKVIKHKNKDEASESFNNYMANRKYENLKKSYKSLTKDGW